jgi:hypothetical protein
VTDVLSSAAKEQYRQAENLYLLQRTLRRESSSTASSRFHGTPGSTAFELKNSIEAGSDGNEERYSKRGQASVGYLCSPAASGRDQIILFLAAMGSRRSGQAFFWECKGSHFGESRLPQVATG